MGRTIPLSNVLRVGCVQPPFCHLSDFLKGASDYLWLLHKQPLRSLHMFQTLSVA